MRPDPDQPHPAIGKFQNLERTGIVDQVLDIFGDQLFRAEPHIHRRSFRSEQFGRIEVFGRSNSSNLCVDVELRIRDLTSDHVDLVAVCQRDDHIGVSGARSLENVRVACMADNRAYVEAILEIPERTGVSIDDGDLVSLFARKLMGNARADPPGSEDQYIHVVGYRVPQALRSLHQF